MVVSLLRQNLSTGFRSLIASLSCRSEGMVNKAKVVMKPWYAVVSSGFNPMFFTSLTGISSPSAMAWGR